MPLFARIRGWLSTAPTRQMIGHSAAPLWASARPYTRPTTDHTRPDYAFWDALRRGQARGYELSGLFCQPITEILAAGVLGDGVQASSGDAYTDTQLSAFLAGHHAELLTLAEDLYALGDQFVIVGADGALHIPPPDTVTATYDPLDYRQLVRVDVTTTLDDRTLTDSYTATERTITTRYHDRRPAPAPQTYPNLLGVIPVIHFANERGSNETHGRPTYAALRRLLERYHTLLDKALDGAELMGNPIPALTGMEDIDEVLAYNETDIQDTTDEGGRPVQRVRLAFDRMMMVILGKGGQFSFVSPRAGFTSDVRAMLKLLFLLILEFTRVPEAVWGGELGASRASAEQQMLPFYQHIQRKRALFGGPLTELIGLWLRAKSLTDTRLRPASLTLRWPTTHAPAEQLRFEWTRWLQASGLITDETALRAANLVDDPAAEVRAATQTPRR